MINLIQLKREVKIGILVVVTLFALGWGFNLLKGHDVFFKGDKYFAVYPNIDGLTEASPIYYKGFKIGTVYNIELHPQQKDNFLLTLQITKSIKVPLHSVAQIYSIDIMGSKGVQLIMSDEVQLHQSGDTLSTSVKGTLVDKMSSQVQPMKDKMDNIMTKMDTLLNNVNKVFNEENKRNIFQGIANFSKSMENIQSITYSMDAQLKSGGNLNNMLISIDSVALQLKQNKEKINQIIVNLHAFSNDLNKIELAKVMINLNQSLAQADTLLTAINQSKGSAGMLINSKEFYNNINKASKDLDYLLLDIQNNPQRYVRFSAMDFGKDVYLTSSESNSSNVGIVYKIWVQESENPLDIRDKQITDSLKIEESYFNNRYVYTAFTSRIYQEAVAQLPTVQKHYPLSKIIALENGNPIKLKKALKR